MPTVVRALKLNILDLSQSKDAKIDRLLRSATDAAKVVNELCWYWDETPRARDMKFTNYNIHGMIYKTLRKRFPDIQSQLVCDIIKDAYVTFHNTKGEIDRIALSFNIPRSGKLKETKKGHPVITIACEGQRLAIPIVRDGGWKRFQSIVAEGYAYTNFRIGRDSTGALFLVVNTKKEYPEVDPGKKNILGVDTGSRTLAAISVVNRKSLQPFRQLYFGRDVWNRQRDICVRRSKLRKHADAGSRKAVRYLKQLVRKESHFTKTRSYQIAHQIVDLAIQYDCVIALEDLNGLIDSKLPTKAKNRKVKRMPYRLFQAALEEVCARSGVPVVKVDPAYTSKTCSKCARLGVRVNNFASFACACGRFVNADRNASVVIALCANTVLRTTVGMQQITEGSPAVSRGVCLNDRASMESHSLHVSGEKAQVL